MIAAVRPVPPFVTPMAVAFQTPVAIVPSVVIADCPAHVALIWTPLGVGGLALATAACAVIQLAIRVRAMNRRRGGPGMPIVDAVTRGAFARTVAATAAMAAATGLASIAFPPGGTWLLAVGETLVLAGIGAVSFTAASRLLKMPELGWALRGRSPD